MEKNYNIFPWSENWWVENDEAWFVLGTQKILCCFDFNTNMCKSVICIPDTNSKEFRLMSGCIKCQNDIYCIPNKGNSIWLYNIDDSRFSEVTIYNPDKVYLDIYDYWMCENKIFAVSIGLKRIIEINVEEKKIDNYYKISENEGISRSTKVGTVIYVLSDTSAKVYGFDLITKDVSIYTFPNIIGNFNTICFDGTKFWFSGYCKEIYVWNREKNEISIADHLPDGFGVYDFGENTDGNVDCLTRQYSLPAFLYSAVIGKYVWFVPYQTNQILYADKVHRILYEFDISEEKETRESLLGRKYFTSKYILEYIKDNRYLGLYSMKNNQTLEIDTEELKYKWCDYDLGDKGIMEYAKQRKYVFREADDWDRKYYRRILQLGYHKAQSNNRNNVGTDIYNGIMHDIV